MAIDTCLDLQTATGTEVYVSAVPVGQCYPYTLTFTVTTAGAIGDRNLTGTSASNDPAVETPPPIAEGTRLKFGSQVVKVTANYPGSGTLAVTPLVAAIPINTVATFYSGIEILAIESAGISNTRQSNTVTLLSSGGWDTMSPSNANWSLPVTLYIPKDPLKLTAYNLVKDAYYNAKYLFIERFLTNGESFQAPAMLSSFNDTVTGAGYVQVQVTFNGNSAPIVDGVLASSAIG